MTQLPQLSSQRVKCLAPEQPIYRLLVVDDNQDHRQCLIKLLKPLGFEIQQAENGQQGIAIWESWRPHIIFMDMQMPIMDGYEATREIKRREQFKWGDREVGKAGVPSGELTGPTPCRSWGLGAKGRWGDGEKHLSSHTKIIALTAYAFEEQRQVMIAAGCDDFISKPFSEEAIFAQLTKHLGVRYIYFEPGIVNQNKDLQSRSLTLEDLAQMPDVWIQKLHTAARECNDESIFQLLAQIPTQLSTLIQVLTQLTYNFRFDEIIKVTDLLVRQKVEEPLHLLQKLQNVERQKVKIERLLS